MLTFKRERAVRPETLEHLDCFFESAKPHRRRIEPDPDSVVLRLLVACAETKFEPAATQHIGSDQLLGQRGWMPEVVGKHGAPTRRLVVANAAARSAGIGAKKVDEK